MLARKNRWPFLQECEEKQANTFEFNVDSTPEMIKSFQAAAVVTHTSIPNKKQVAFGDDQELKNPQPAFAQTILLLMQCRRGKERKKSISALPPSVLELPETIMN